MVIMVRYKLKADRVKENEALVREVYAALAREKPEGLRYATFKLADGVSFMHVSRVDTTDGKNPLVAVEAFKRFTAAIRERCEEPPVTTEMEEVGSYRMLSRLE
jgi:hypothetical protein